MYVIIGANGYLGGYVVQAVLDKTKEPLIATARRIEKIKRDPRIKWISCDVQSETSVDALIKEMMRYEQIKIIYLAAYHHPELVETNRELAWDINVTSLSRIINKLGFVDKIYYVSTDSVYGDSIDHYHFKEGDPLNPVNFYGHNKCAAEAIMVHSGRNVVRFPFLISPSVVEKKHFYDVIVETLKQGKPFEMFADSYRSSLGFDRAAELLVALMESDDRHQVVNVCGDRDLSKYDVGVLIAEKEQLDPELIVPVSAEASKEWNMTKRASSTLMDNSLLKQILKLEFIDVFEKPICAVNPL